MSLRTPEAIRTLQRKLYGKAKAEPAFRFYLLYDKVWRADILHHADDLARANGGAPGVDGMTFERIEAAGLEDWLSRLGEELRAKACPGLDPGTYRCQPVRRVMIPKPGGGERPLGIPTIRDRVDRGKAGTGADSPGLASPARGQASKRTWTRRRTAIGRDAVQVRRSRRC